MGPGQKLHLLWDFWFLSLSSCQTSCEIFHKIRVQTEKKNLQLSHDIFASSADLRSDRVVSLSQGARYAQASSCAALRASTLLSNLHQAPHSEEWRSRKLWEWPFKIKGRDSPSDLQPANKSWRFFFLSVPQGGGESRDSSPGGLLVADIISATRAFCYVLVLSSSISLRPLSRACVYFEPSDRKWVLLA